MGSPRNALHSGTLRKTLGQEHRGQPVQGAELQEVFPDEKVHWQQVRMMIRQKYIISRCINI